MATEGTPLYSTMSVEQDPEEAHDEYGQLCRRWGSMGGRATLERYGRDHFRRLALRRWEIERTMAQVEADYDEIPY